MTGQSEKSGIEIECEYQLTGHPVAGFSYVKLPRFNVNGQIPIPEMKTKQSQITAAKTLLFICQRSFIGKKVGNRRN